MRAATEGGERLNRYLARRGVSSRRAADLLIAAGRVRVNGVVAQVGARVDLATDVVEVSGAEVPRTLPERLTIALNKPAGVVTTLADPHGRPTVRDLVEPTPGLVPIGRLDADSRGLLLLTTDGDLAHAVAHPRHGVHKTYRVRTRAPLDEAQQRALRDGVGLEDGPVHALAVTSVDDRTIDVVMGEGRKRVVRRMVAAVGGEVEDLCRIAVGPVELGSLAEGRTRVLEATEVAALARTARVR